MEKTELKNNLKEEIVDRKRWVLNSLKQQIEDLNKLLEKAKENENMDAMEVLNLTHEIYEKSSNFNASIELSYNCMCNARSGIALLENLD